MAAFDWTQEQHTFHAAAEFTNATVFADGGAPDDVRSFDSGSIYIRAAPLEAIANDPPITFRVQTQATDAVVNSAWNDTGLQVALDTAAPIQQTLDGAAASAQKVIPLALTTNLAVGDQAYIRNTDAGTGEWIEIAEIAAGVSITAVDDLVASYSDAATSDTVTTGALKTEFPIDLKGKAHVRVLMTNYDGTGANWAAEVTGLWATDFSDA